MMAVGELPAARALALAGAALLLGHARLVLWRRQRRGAHGCAAAARGVLLGVDIGATSVKAGLVDLQGRVLTQALRKIGDDRGLEAVCSIVRELSEGLLASRGLRAVELAGMGLCVPGAVDAARGEVLFASNFTEWPRPARIADTVQRELGLRPAVENDGNAALMGEVWCGAAKGARDAAILTLGTGVGSALLSDGRLVRGHTGLAGEVGHTIVERGGRLSRGSGVRGILEEYASARAVGMVGSERLGRPLTCAEVFELSSKGDRDAAAVLEDLYDVLGVACINLTRVLDLEVVLLAGGMTGAGAVLEDGVRRRFAAHHWTLAAPSCAIRIAHLGASAGIVGAAALARPAPSNQ